jgi:methionyl-tRNA formyltransferase
VIEVGKDRILVATGAGALVLLTVQLAGKKAMDMDAFLRGARIEVGERFEDCR